MGMALSGDRLAIGTKIQVWEFVDVPAVTAKLEPPRRHDACFLPRSCHVTGNIQIHEMAWGGNELWVGLRAGSIAEAEVTPTPSVSGSLRRHDGLEVRAMSQGSGG